jgi:hypothetical protein
MKPELSTQGNDIQRILEAEKETRRQKDKVVITTSGPAGSGKDYVLENLITEFDNKDKFAQTIKDIINEIISNGNEKYSEEVFEEIKNNPNRKYKVGEKEITVREMLQILGTDVIREINPDFHIKMLARRLLKSDKLFHFIPDARFDNEFNFVVGLNKLETPAKKEEYLRAISLFEEAQLPIEIQLKNQIEDSFGENEFSNELFLKLKDKFYNPEYMVESFNPTEKSLNEGIREKHNFTTFEEDLKCGIIFINRDSDRELPDHSSEAKSVDRIRFLRESGESQRLGFDNNITPLEENQQYKNIEEQMILKRALSLYNSSKLILPSHLIIIEGNPKNINDLGKILDQVEQEEVPLELKSVIERYEDKFPKRTRDKSQGKSKSIKP